MNHVRPYNYFLEQFSEEIHLIQLMKSGNVNAFVKIYDLYVCEIYRYLYFFSSSNQVVEGITYKVFITAWEQIHQYRFQDTSFLVWLYSIAKNQITKYQHTYPHAISQPSIESLSQMQITDAKSIQSVLHVLNLEEQQMLVFKYIVGMPNKEITYIFRKPQEQIQKLQIEALYAFTKHIGHTNLQNPSSQLHSILDDCLIRISAEMDTLDYCLKLYSTHASILKPLLETALELGEYSEVEPALTFNAYRRDSLSRYLQSQPRRQPSQSFQIRLPNKVMMQQIVRTVVLFFILASLTTGTVKAQSAMPGDSLYAWKRTSEYVWLKVASEPEAVKLILVDRRFDEFIAVSEDSSQRATALVEYQNAVENLTLKYDEESLTLILPELQRQQEVLTAAGYSSSVLDEFITSTLQIDIAENPNTETDILIEEGQEENSTSVTCEPICADEPLSNNSSEETNNNGNNSDVTNATDDNANNNDTQNSNDSSNENGDEIGEEVGDGDGNGNEDDKGNKDDKGDRDDKGNNNDENKGQGPK